MSALSFLEIERGIFAGGIYERKLFKDWRDFLT
jgi:hypothetical protein